MLTAIGDVMRKAYDRGWITTRDGNISVRKGSNFYITPSGWRKTIIHPEHLLKAKIAKDGSLQWNNNLGLKPSEELEMHKLIQLQDFDKNQTRAVVHLHPTFIIAAMYKGFDLQKIAKDFPEVSRYTEVGPCTGILPATSSLLATETLKSLSSPENKLIYNIVGQNNHGVCAVADNPWDAFEHIERLEHICQIVLVSGVRP